MTDNNKMNPGQNDPNKSQKPGMGSEKQVGNTGTQDQNKNKNPGQNPDKGAPDIQRQQSSTPSTGKKDDQK